jgi:hypothetical protein
VGPRQQRDQVGALVLIDQLHRTLRPASSLPEHRLERRGVVQHHPIRLRATIAIGEPDDKRLDAFWDLFAGGSFLVENQRGIRLVPRDRQPLRKLRFCSDPDASISTTLRADQPHWPRRRWRLLLEAQSVQLCQIDGYNRRVGKREHRPYFVGRTPPQDDGLAVAPRARLAVRPGQRCVREVC